MPKSTKPISEKQAAANCANAAKSTGPTTPEGKARSAQNARKHGFAAAHFAVVRLEELDSLTHLHAETMAAYQPVNSEERFAVERIALSKQALRRCAALESGLHTAAMNETITPGGLPPNLLSAQLTEDIQVTRAQNRNLCLAVGFERLVGKSDTWKLFLRYQAQTERLFRRAVEEFDRLKAQRSEFPNEPIPPPDPNETVPVEDLLPIAPLDEEEAARAYAALFDPTIAVTRNLCPGRPSENVPQNGDDKAKLDVDR